MIETIWNGGGCIGDASRRAKGRPAGSPKSGAAGRSWDVSAATSNDARGAFMTLSIVRHESGEIVVPGPPGACGSIGAKHRGAGWFHREAASPSRTVRPPSTLDAERIEDGLDALRRTPQPSLNP